MTTSKPMYQQQDLLTSSPQVGRAKTLASPERAKALMATDLGYGAKLPELLAKYDRDSLCWRTSQRCFIEGWTVLLGSWPRSGMTVSGIAYRLQPLALRTDATGSGLLPTPAASHYGTQKGQSKGASVRPSLPTMAKHNLWPTPKSSPSGPDFARTNRSESGGDDLATAVARTMMPTPTVGDSRTSGSRNTPESKANAGVSLTDAARGDQGQGRIWPTPAAHEGRLGYQDRSSGKKGSQESLTTSVMHSEGRKPSETWTGGQLNPTWVEWLMGYPTGWTDLSA